MTAHPVLACVADAESRAAVRLAGELASAVREPLRLVSAYPYEPVSFSARPMPDAVAESGFRHAVERLGRARAAVPSGVVVLDDLALPAGSVADAVCTSATDLDACLIAVGPDLDGDVAKDIVRRSSCPVAVAPIGPGPSRRGPKRIGVAFDGSPEAHCAITAAMHLAIATDARVEVMTVGPDSDNAAAAVARLSEAVDARLRRAVGDPAARLVQFSADLDLLVCGSRGRRRMAGVLLGSVSTTLLEASRCALLVMPAGVRQRAVAPLGVSTAAAD